MKSFHLLSASLVLLAAGTGCRTQQYSSENVVAETYVHRYGVELGAEDWSARGQDGQVVSMRRDGVLVSKNYVGGVLNGETTYTFPHKDLIQKKEVYDNGLLTQDVHYYLNGIPQQQVNYNDGGQETVLVWYETGSPQIKEEYQNKLLVQGEYFTADNQRESAVNQGNGLRTRRDEFGMLISVDTINNGELTLRTTYHLNGAPATITPFVNGVEDGQRQTYLVNGEPATIETWKNGIRNGWTIVFENGEKVAEVPYVGGVREGVEKRYRDEKTLVGEVTWSQDRKQGPAYSYVNATRQTDWYFNDREVNKQTYEALSNQ